MHPAMINPIKVELTQVEKRRLSLLFVDFVGDGQIDNPEAAIGLLNWLKQLVEEQVRGGHA
jgi:hypothetical protein